MKKIGIVVAMEEEKQEIKNIMKDIQIEKIYNLQFEIGKIGDTTCILVKSGIGKVNAARTTQVLIQNYNIDCIINLGAAGAIGYDLDIGDIIIAKKVIQHDFDLTAFGHKKGYISGVGEGTECNMDLVSSFENMLDNIKNKEYKIKMGIVVSGDIFCTEEKMKDKINKKFNADVVDMECSAIAQVAYLDNIPFISVRCVSDIPNGGNVSTFDENLKMASKRCAEILKSYVNIQNTASTTSNKNISILART